MNGEIVTTLLRNCGPTLKLAITIMSVAIVGTYVGALIIDGPTLDRLNLEDGLIENVGAFFFLVAAIGFLAVALLSAGRDPDSTGFDVRRKLVFGLLAALMFICFGEEISWGQRIFGWSTPTTISELNAQGETNFHNLHIVHQWNRDGTEKDFVGKLVNMNRLFSVFWLAVFVLLPLAAHLSAPACKFIDAHKIPVPPMWCGALFLINYGIYKVLATIYAGTIRAPGLDEIKETNYAAIYAFLALVAVVFALRRRSTN
jgi:hypothetical protein